MKRLHIVGAAGILLVGVGAYFFSAAPTDRDAIGSRSMQSGGPAEENTIANSALPHKMSPPRFQPGSRGQINPFPEVPRSRDKLPLEDDPFIAESIAEQRWLDRNGYPNSRQWTIYSMVSDAMLEQAALSGDEVAGVMLHGRALMKGDMSAPKNLMEAAANGSNFALSLLSAYLAGSSKGNPQLGYAISRVSEMRGDWRSAVGRDGMFPRPLSAEDRILAEANAIRIFNNLKKQSKNSNFVDPRPLGI